MHTQFDLTWYGCLPWGKPQIQTRAHTKEHSNVQRAFTLTNPTYSICLWKNCITSVQQTQQPAFFPPRGPGFDRIEYVIMNLSAWQFKKHVGLWSQGSLILTPGNIKHGLRLGVLCLVSLQRLSLSAYTYYQNLMGPRKRNFPNSSYGLHLQDWMLLAIPTF